MSVEYASETVGRQIAGDLRRSARSTGHPESLPGFLGVHPHEGFSKWRRAFADRSRAVANGTEGTVEAQVQLCQNLQPHLQQEGSWLRLMNRLGRDQIESAVAALARRGATPEAVRAARRWWVDTLECDVGVRQAGEVVEDVFASYDLEIPPPQDEPAEAPPTDVRPPVPSADTVEDQRQPVVEPDSAFDEYWRAEHLVQPADAQAPGPADPDAVSSDDTEPASGPPAAGGGLLGILGGALLEVIGDRLDRRIERARERRQESDEAPRVEGQWFSDTGASFRFSQRGSIVSVDGGQFGAPVRGRGRIVGRSVELQGFSPAGGPFRCGLELSPDGTTMSGQLVDGFGRGSHVALHR